MAYNRRSDEWMPGEFFIKHTVDVTIGEDRMESLEIIGYDDTTNTYPMHSFDNTGKHDVMHMDVNSGVWTFHGNYVRSACSFSEDGNIMNGKWEKQDEHGHWLSWMNVELRKFNS